MAVYGNVGGHSIGHHNASPWKKNYLHFSSSGGITEILWGQPSAAHFRTSASAKMTLHNSDFLSYAQSGYGPMGQTSMGCAFFSPREVLSGCKRGSWPSPTLLSIRGPSKTPDMSRATLIALRQRNVAPAMLTIAITTAAAMRTVGKPLLALVALGVPAPVPPQHVWCSGSSSASSSKQELHTSKPSGESLVPPHSDRVALLFGQLCPDTLTGGVKIGLHLRLKLSGATAVQHFAREPCHSRGLAAVHVFVLPFKYVSR